MKIAFLAFIFAAFVALVSAGVRGTLPEGWETNGWSGQNSPRYGANNQETLNCGKCTTSKNESHFSTFTITPHFFSVCTKAGY